MIRPQSFRSVQQEWQVYLKWMYVWVEPDTRRWKQKVEAFLFVLPG